MRRLEAAWVSELLTAATDYTRARDREETVPTLVNRGNWSCCSTPHCGKRGRQR